MARRLILDTGVLIGMERRRAAISRIIDNDDDVVIAAVTYAELEVGVELASDEHRAVRQAFVDGVLEAIPIVDYDRRVAVEHARLLAAIHRAGRPRGTHDTLIAATAVATGRTLLTTDRAADFEHLPGVDVEFVG